jgi:hypothetical protein
MMMLATNRRNGEWNFSTRVPFSKLVYWSHNIFLIDFKKNKAEKMILKIRRYDDRNFLVYLLLYLIKLNFLLIICHENSKFTVI